MKNTIYENMKYKNYRLTAVAWSRANVTIYPHFNEGFKDILELARMNDNNEQIYKD